MSLVDIRAVKMEEAGKLLTPVLVDIYVKYGLDLTSSLLAYYLAKGIMLSTDLSKEEKLGKIKEAYQLFGRALKVLDKDKILS